MHAACLVHIYLLLTLQHQDQCTLPAQYLLVTLNTRTSALCLPGTYLLEVDSRGEWAKRLLRVFGCALAAVVVEGVVMVILLQAADQARHAPGAAERIMACEEEKQGWSDANYSFQLLHKILSRPQRRTNSCPTCGTCT